jgi:hypothetical protein
MGGIGHNSGPTLDDGTSWRRHCWQAARAALLPVLPIEVVRTRVRRAAELGLEYRTYASIRAASGHDVIAFLFSSNALKPLTAAAIPPERAARLAALAGAGRAGLARAPLGPDALAALAGPVLDRAHPAPRPFAPWAEARAALAVAHAGWPRDGVVLVGAGPDEPDWAQAARLAWFLPADRFFAAQS